MPGRRRNLKPVVNLSEHTHKNDGLRMSSKFDDEESGSLNTPAPCGVISNSCGRSHAEHFSVGPKNCVESKFSSPTPVDFDHTICVSHDCVSPGALNPEGRLSTDAKFDGALRAGNEQCELSGPFGADILGCNDELLQEEIEIKMEELKLRRMQFELVKRRERHRRVTSTDQFHPEPRPPQEQERFSASIRKCPGSADGNECMPGSSSRMSAGAICLPKIEIQPFDGSVRSFWSFMKSFETTVGCKLADGAEKLSYLLYYCRGPARESIENCVLLDPEVGYSEALRILKSQYGRPHVVMQTLMRDILDGPVLVIGDLEGLRSLARKMRGCLITLTQMDRLTELNCSSNLVRIVERLPKEARYRWAEMADAIINDGREPCFEELLLFIEGRVSVASNMYGVAAASTSDKYCRSFPKQVDLNRRVLATYTPAVTGCLFCQGEHSLEVCDGFLNAAQSDKLAVLSKHKRCFLCLKPNHMAKDCRVSTRCAMENCGGRHHTIMHARPVRKLPSVEAGESSSHCGAVASQGKSAGLGFVPVKLVYNSKTVLTYALIDNGSDVTLIDDVVSQALGILGKSHNLTIRTLHGTKSLPTMEAALEIHSLDSKDIIPVDLAYVVKQLPITHIDKMAVVKEEDWKHLRGVRCEVLENDRVGILIGCNVPEAHWVIEQRVGDRMDPYAIKSLLGWCIRGPQSSFVKRERCVNCIGVEEISHTKGITESFELDFVNAEYADMKAPSIEDALTPKVDKSLTYPDWHYEIGLPWRPDKEKLLSNFVTADNAVEKKLFVDDCLLSVEFVPQAKQVIDEIHSMLRVGGFKPTKLVSKHPEVVSHLKSNIRDCKYMNMHFEITEPQKTPGIT